MSFSRVNASGWSVGDVLTSAQITSLDVDHAKALDKSSAGDTISGTVNFSGSGNINANQAQAIVVSATDGLHVPTGGTITLASGSFMNVNSGATIEANAGSTIIGQASGAIAANHAGAITTFVAKGINDGGFANGIAASVAGGISDGGTTGGITGTVAGGITSGASGGIELTGGSGDYVTYQTGHTAQFFVSANSPNVASGWSYTGTSPFLTGPGTSAIQVIPIPRIFNGLYNNAVLSFVQLVMNVASSHSGVPANLPNFSVKRVGIAGIGSPLPAAQDLYSGGTVTFPTPGSGALWYSSGNLQELQMTCNQNNAINSASYYYYILLQDEWNTNSISGNQYYGFNLVFTGITTNACG